MHALPFWIIFVPIGAFAMVTTIIWLRSRHKQVIAAHERDVQLALLSKFSTAEEMTQFLATPQGRHFVDHLAKPKGIDPRRQLIEYLTSGLITLFCGFALMLLAKGLPVLAIGGFMCLAVGSALLIAGGLTYPIAKRIGLVPPPSSDTQ